MTTNKRVLNAHWNVSLEKRGNSLFLHEFPTEINPTTDAVVNKIVRDDFNKWYMPDITQGVKHYLTEITINRALEEMYQELLSMLENSKISISRPKAPWA